MPSNMMIVTLFSGLLLATAAKSQALHRRDCTFSVTANSGDTCSSIASDWGITLDQFISSNPSVGSGCSKGVVPGIDYCVDWDNWSLPTTSATSTSSTSTSTQTTTTPSGPSPTQAGITSDCKSFYKVATGDTCQKIVDLYGTFTLDDFYSWNPAVESDCSTLLRGYYVCVGISNTPTAAPTTTTATATTTGAPTAPSPTQSGIISTCVSYYKVGSDDTCQKIVDKYGTFTLDDFYTWNPSLGTECSSLWGGYYVCVGVPGTPTSKPTTTLATTTSAPSAPTPTQSGLVSFCTSYYKVGSGDTCQKIVDKYGTFTLANFYSWNPSVGNDCSQLWGGYYVCVSVPGTPTAPVTTTTTKTSTTSASGPTPTQTGIISTCNSYYQAKKGDYCQKVLDLYKTFTLQQFYTWNPSVGSDCSSLWEGYYYCVGVRAAKRRMDVGF
ncbi:LysM domain-containing protein [Diaporthe sp. PMI_573]|nr:LysM domain-containing protein [Diaporthaceae sp. PMI_573]